MARTKEFDEADVLERAMDLFWRKGYNATTAQDLVDELGISRSSMYGTFGDKHALFMRALERYRAENVDPVLRGVDDTADVAGYLHNFFGGLQFQEPADARARGCLMVNSVIEMASCDPGINALVADIQRSTEEALIRLIRRGQREGVFTPEASAQSLARFVANTVNGLRVTMKIDTDPAVLDDIIQQCLRALRA